LKTEENVESLKQRFARYSRHGSKFDRAVQTALLGGVKEHLFLPSGRKIYTVVGKLGDEFIDPERPYCSCSNFFFRVLGHKDELCYHLLSFIIASDSGLLDTVTFSDEEYDSVMAAVVKDVFQILDSEGNP
jgi:predicted nucleic acid-binding Zn finger protein